MPRRHPTITVELIQSVPLPSKGGTLWPHLLHEDAKAIVAAILDALATADRATARNHLRSLGGGWKDRMPPSRQQEGDHDAPA